MDGLGPQDGLQRQSSSLFDSPYYNTSPNGHANSTSMNWNVHTAHFSAGVSPHQAQTHALPPSSDALAAMSSSSGNVGQSTQNGTQGILTRRQRAALSVGRGMESATAQMFSIGDTMQYPSMFAMSASLSSLPTHDTRAISPSASLSANPADISPLARRAHSRHISLNSAFEPEPLTLSPTSTYSRGSRPYVRASSPASSIASSSVTSISGSISAHSQSTWSSTNESSPSRVLDADDLSSSASPDGNRSAREKHTKNKLRNADRKAMCIYATENPNVRQEDIAVRFGVERSTVSKVLKNKAQWLSIEDEEELKIAKHRPTKFPEIEKDVLQWVQERVAAGEIVSDAGLKEQAKLSARRYGIGEDMFKASGGWIENFKNRNRIKRGRINPPRSERSRLQTSDSVSIASPADDPKFVDSVRPMFNALSMGDPSRLAHATPVEHAYATRSKTINAYELQQSVETLNTFLYEVYPEGFTAEERSVFNAIKERTARWAIEQMRTGL